MTQDHTISNQQVSHSTLAPSFIYPQPSVPHIQTPVQGSSTSPLPPQKKSPPPSPQTLQRNDSHPNEPHPGLAEARQISPSHNSFNHLQSPNHSVQVSQDQQRNPQLVPPLKPILSIQQTPASNHDLESIESQMHQITIGGDLPLDQSTSQVSEADAGINRALYPRPLQIHNKNSELIYPELESNSNTFAVELPGCNVFSSRHESLPQEFVAELPGCQPEASKSPSPPSPSVVAAVTPAASISDQSRPHVTSVPTTTVAAQPVQPGCLSCCGDLGTSTKHTQFYVLKAHRDFGVCKACYLSKIAISSEFASYFTPYSGADTEMVCYLSFTGIYCLVMEQCVPQNTIHPLLEFTTALPTLGSCNHSKDSGTMYVSRENRFPGFLICPLCFELNIRHTAFEGYFEAKASSEEDQQACRMTMQYYKKALRNELQKESDFDSFIDEATVRLNMPDCTGMERPVPSIAEGSYVVFTAAAGKTGNICPACYCDHLAYTSLADAFVAANFEEDQIGNIFCDLAGNYTKVAMDVAIKRGDDEVWRKAVELERTSMSSASARGVD